MNKADLVNAVAGKSGMSKKDSEKVISAVFESINEALAADDKVQIMGFGSFEVKERAQKNGLNPRTKETMVIPACKAVVFKSGKALKDSVQ